MQDVSCTADHLTPGTSYEFVIHATNGVGSVQGSPVQFTTAPAGHGGAGFTISANPASLSLGPSASGTTMITVQSLGSFSTPVSVAATGSGFNFAWSPLNPVL